MKWITCNKELEEGVPKVTLTGIREIPVDSCSLEGDIAIPYRQEFLLTSPGFEGSMGEEMGMGKAESLTGV